MDLSNNNFYNSWNDPQWQPEKWELGKFKLWEKKDGVQAQSDDEEALLNETLMQALANGGDVDIWGEVTDAFNDAQMDEMLTKMTPITNTMMMNTVEAGTTLSAQAEELPKHT